MSRKQINNINCWNRCLVHLYFLLALLASSNSLAQNNPPFLSYKQVDGLSSNYIRTLFQDHAGFMWIGTENGLNRFDGNHFVTYRFDPDDSTSISNNWILSLHEDSSYNLWVGTQRGLNRLDRSTGYFERIFVHESVEKNQALEISGILEDKEGNIWAIANNHTLLRVFQKADGAYLLKEEEQITSQLAGEIYISGVLQDQSGHFWLRTQNGLVRWHPDTKVIKQFSFPFDTGTIESGMIEGRMAIDQSGDIILFGNQSGIFTLSPAEKKPKIRPLEAYEQIIKLQPDLDTRRLYYMTINPKNQLWAVYENKVLEIDLNKPAVVQNHLKELSFPFDIHVLTIDKEGALWVGMAGGGISIENLAPSPFSFFGHNQEDPASLSPGVVRTFAETNDGQMWVGLLGNGIDLLDINDPQDLNKKANLRHNPRNDASLSGDLIIELHKGKQNQLWIATNSSGLDEYNMETGQWTHYRHEPSNPNSISQDRIWGITEDPEGWVWIGAFQEGLNRLDPKTGAIQRYLHDPKDSSSLLDDQIKSLYTDSHGEVWIGSHAGLSHFHKKEERIYHFTHDPNNPSSISNGIVWCMYEDHQGNLWVGTGLGLNRFDRKNNTFERFYEKDGLPSNTIYGILQDNEQNLWVSTDAGLALLLSTDTENNFRAIKQKDGLASTSFVPKAFFKSSINGLLYFGSTAGIVIVDPLQLSREQIIPRLRLHSFTRNNLRSNEGGLITDYFTEQKSKDIALTHLDQAVSLAFTDLRWEKNKPYTYTYQLIGLNKRWMPLAENMKVTFANLDPGNYRLKLRAIDRYGQIQQEKSMLTLQVYPPWWRSGWAYGIYVILVLLILLILYRLQLRRQLEKQEAASLRRLDNFKNRLYANITHEFRTPLTIIGGMAEQIRKEPDRWLEKGTRMISDNNANLLNLVDQMLELQKVESGGLNLNYRRANIIPFLRSIYEQFEGFAQSGKQILTFNTEIARLEMDYDEEKITRILTNLLSNAIKYTPEKGEISLSISTTQTPESLHLAVTDTGIGIPSDQLPHVFDRFFQASNNEHASRIGSGIGLSLTHELVKLMGGDIKVKSTEGKGSTFSISIPVSRNAAPQAATSTTKVQTAVIGKQGPSKPVTTPTNSDLPIALIVEDNSQIVEYISICLQNHYQLLLASDGQQGIDLAIEQIPDIIISDVMMPKKNGFELCNLVKEDQRTSHIPIIMLTAKVDVASRITGLQQGADDYLAKPFHEEELLVRMKNLLAIRQKLQARYQDLYNQPISQEIDIQKIETIKEDTFILKLKAAFEARIDDPDFNAKALAQEMHLSRSQLGRKVKALTGRSLSIYLRSLRLQKAKFLLQSTKLPIKEIAYEVGFPTPNYFTTSYTEEFGESPTDTREIS